MGRRRRVHLKRYWLTRSPKLFSRGRIETEQRFFFTLTGEDVDLATGYYRRRMSQPDCNLPIFLQSLGPLRRQRGSAAVAIGATPLGPILRIARHGKKDCCERRQNC